MKSAFFAASLCSGFVWATVGLAEQRYGIIPLGHFGSEHTSSGGERFSEALRINSVGQVAGISARYNRGVDLLGYTAWFFDGTTTRTIGLTDSEHNDGQSGYRSSTIIDMNQAGCVIGTSARLNGGGGQSPWIYDGNKSVKIGLFGSEHTSSNGYKYSDYLALNETGQVTGYSERYNGGNSSLGRSVWLYDGTSTKEIGFTGPEYSDSYGHRFSSIVKLTDSGLVAGYSRLDGRGPINSWIFDGVTTQEVGLADLEHTRADGTRQSTIYDLNEAGQAFGTSQRFNGSNSEFGSSAWFYDGFTATSIGLADSVHTRADGRRTSSVQHMNESGVVLGASTRYSGSTNFGTSVWLYHNGMTIDIGLKDQDHTRSDGYRRSSILLKNDLNDLGQATGSAQRFDEHGNYVGDSAWFYDGTFTHRIGLTGPGQTRGSGFQYSEAELLNDAGQVVGFSDRYNGGNIYLGQSAWIFDGGTTLEIGLTGQGFTREDGYTFGVATLLNEAGNAIGYSNRYVGASYKGREAWIYDTESDQTISIRLSTTSDGFAFSEITHLGENGLALGQYRLYDSADNYLGDRAFSYDKVNGVQDLGALVEGGLSQNGWQYLKEATELGGHGRIIGSGLLSIQSEAANAFLLSPIVVESADFNMNGVVDGNDFLIWQRGFGAVNAERSLGDANGDSLVDEADFEIWQNQFGIEAAVSLDSASFHVPEPEATVLTIMGCCLLHALRSRQLNFAAGGRK